MLRSFVSLEFKEMDFITCTRKKKKSLHIYVIDVKIFEMIDLERQQTLLEIDFKYVE